MTPMRMRTRVIAALAAAVALLAPASVAQAAPPYTLTIDSFATLVLAPQDGYLDSTDIIGTVDAGGAIERIRGSVVITVGGRVLKTFPLSSTGPFHLTWNGYAGNGTIVPGTATVTLRVDGQAPVSDSLIVSAKRLVKYTRTTSQPAWLIGPCRDDMVFSGAGAVNAEIKHIDKICPTPRDARQNILRLVMRGTQSTGAVTLTPSYDPSYGAITNIRPAIISVTATFHQTGSGSNQFYLCETPSCTPPSGSTLVTFTKSGTYTTTGGSWDPSDPDWRIVVNHGHDVSLTKFTIKITYWRLV